MIGGFDIASQVPASTENLRLILELVFREWPEGVVEDYDEDGCRPIHQVLQSHNPAVSNEFFLYPNVAAYTAWTADGGIEENQGLMMHVLMDPDGTTLVVDKPGGALAGLAESIQNNLRLAHIHSFSRLSLYRDAA